MLSREQILHFETLGYVILEDFMSDEVCENLRQHMNTLIETSPEKEIKSVFSTGADRQLKDQYFLESGNKIRFFLEENSNLYNKCGHALHNLDPIFSQFSYQSSIQQIWKDLQFKNPYILQSMYIFKHPYVGGEVSWHQDTSFLYTKPDTLLGMWFALDDASRENGCLWAIPGAHKETLRCRFLRLQNDELGFEYFDKTPFEIEKALPLEVKKGSLILLNSKLPHMSQKNLSDSPRHAYTLHLYDSAVSEYPKDNWLQTNKD